MRLFKSESYITYIFQIEIILVVSLTTAFFICSLLPADNLKKENKDTQNRLSLIRNYRILNDFLNETRQTSPTPSQPLKIEDQPDSIKDTILLESAREQLDDKHYQSIPALLDNLRGDYHYIQSEKQKIYLEYLYARKQYRTFLEEYDRESLPDNRFRRMFLHCLVETGKPHRAFLQFRELFKTNQLYHFQRILSTGQLQTFLKKLTYEEWFEKFHYLVGRRQYSELFREQKYCPFQQLNYLFNAEYNYRRRRYSRSLMWLNRINSNRLQNHIENLQIKIKIRRDEYEDIMARIDALKDDKVIYPQLLLDSGGLLTVKGEYKLGLELFSRYIALSRIDSESHWRVLWISAWIHYRQNDRKKALKYFAQASWSPMTSYRLASEYWYKKLKKRRSGILTQAPFSYYFIKNLPTGSAPLPDHFNSQILDSFAQLIDGETGPLFRKIVSDLAFMREAGFIEESIQFIRRAQDEPRLTRSGQNMLKIIESILYLKEEKLQLSFVNFRKKFPHYHEIVLPRFLREIYLPVRYESLVRLHAGNNRIDPLLVFALIREESFFRSNAVSPARARGLMQLMLGTARSLAHPYGIRPNRKDLFDPEFNIRFGCLYLKQLLDRYDGKAHLALAAYNAGEHRVDRWLREFGKVPDDEFIEMIPFTETRNYVKTILRNYFYYRHYYQ